MGETSRSLGTRFKEHAELRAPLTAIGEHAVNSNHKIMVEDVQFMEWEDHFWKRKIREIINRDTGYDLLAIYDDLLSHDHSSLDGHVTRRYATQR